MKLIQCAALFQVPTRLCGQYRRCIRELGHAGFCMSIHYGWPFHWLRSSSPPLPPSFSTDSPP